MDKFRYKCCDNYLAWYSNDNQRRNIKYKGELANNPIIKLSVSANIGILVAVSGTVAGCVLVIYLASQRTSLTRNMYEAAILSLSLVHFYLDGLFWAFRDPQVRRSLGPYIFGASTRPAPSLFVARS